MSKRKPKMKLSSRRNGTLVPDDDDSDSDLQEFPLPKKRIIKPGKSTYVARRRCGCCRVCASVFLSILLIASVLCVIVLGWFSLRLKRDLDFMRKRLSKVESFDRSTSREYESLNNDLTNKYKTLQTGREETTKHDHEQFKSILKQIAYLNSTVKELKKKVKLPGSARTLTNDIESLKKGMADTGGDITEIKDKIKQLTDLAGLQRDKMGKLATNVYNLSVQVAQVMGKPTPKAPQNTGTPPLILRMPVNADEKQQEADKSVVKNFTAQISVEVGRIMGIVTTVNHTLSYEVSKLGGLMKSLLKEVKKHVVTLDDLQTKVSQVLTQNHSSVVSRGHLEPDSEMLSEHVFNLSVAVKKLSDDVEQHSRNLAELMLEVVQINATVSQRQNDDMPEKSTPCNCTPEVGKIWEQLSSNKLSIEAVQQELQTLQMNVKSLSKNNISVLDITEASLTEDKKPTENQSLIDSVASQTDKDLEQDDLESENVKPSPTSRSNANDSVPKVDKVTDSVTANPIEQNENELEAENVKLSPSSRKNGSDSVSKVDKLTESPVTVLPSGHANSAQHPIQPLNTTAPPQVTFVNSTEDNQNSSSDHKIQIKVVKLSTPSTEETLEESLEHSDSDSS